MINRLIQFFEEHTYLLYLSLATLTIITLSLTLLPSNQITTHSLLHYDKLGHTLMFGSWTFFLGLLLFVSGQRPLPLFSIFLAGSLFGISIEVLQGVLPSDRNMDLYDVFSDLAGCVLAVLALKILATKLYSVQDTSRNM